MAKTKTASKPKVTAKPTPDQPGVTTMIREVLINNELATVDEIKTELAQHGHPVAPSTISAVRFHILHTIRVLRSMGLLPKRKPPVAAVETREAEPVAAEA